MDTPLVYLTMFIMFLGLLASFLVPYYRKLKEEKITSLDWKYVVHLIGTAIWQFFLGFPVYTAWEAPDILNTGFILVLAFAFGYGGSALQKELEKVFHLLLNWNPGM